MTTPIIDYTLDRLHVSNPDGTLPIDFVDVDVTTFTSPIIVAGHTYRGALDFSTASHGASVDITTIQNLPVTRFHSQVIFFAESTVRGTLVESDRLPFSLGLTTTNGDTYLTASIKSYTVGWRATETFGTRVVTEREWYVADVIYDTDTLGVFLDGAFVSLHGLGSECLVAAASSGSFTVGSASDGGTFKGLIAAVKLNAGIPPALESEFDKQRTSPQWFITTKLESIRPVFDLGKALDAPMRSFSSKSEVWTQDYENGLVQFHSAAASAFEIHGAIHLRFRRLQATAPDLLGFLISDVQPSLDKSGVKALFSKGAIYYSPALHDIRKGAVEVVGQIYLDYEASGESLATGFPLAPAVKIDGGSTQLMFKSTWLYRDNGTKAHFVQGAIRDLYEDTGAWSYWGYPTTDESDVELSGQTRVAKMSEFENGATFYWSATTGAHFVRGDIRRKYNSFGGPQILGLPISDEIDIPGVLNGKISAFENGTICWFGAFEKTFVAQPFHFHLAVIDTVESEGFGMDQNDVYIQISIKQNDKYLINERYPPSGDSDDHNIWTPEITFPPRLVPALDTTFTVVIHVYDHDPLDPDDDLGLWQMTLDASNAWGFADHQGIWNSGPFAKINNLLASAKVEVDPSLIQENHNFWGFHNQDTSRIDRSEFAEAFPGVDSDPEWWDITDGVDSIFFELFVTGCAKHGTCYGMSLEAAYARIGASPFALPLSQYTEWSTAQRRMNVKQQYQLGAQALWWFAERSITGSMHNPIDVFNATLDSFNEGKQPLLNFYETYSFGGVAHTVEPVAWNTSAKPWVISVHDPNYPAGDPNSDSDLRTVTVDPTLDDNWFTFVYQPGVLVMNGGRWSGSRMFYIDLDIVGTAPRVPTWEAIGIIVAGIVIICGDGIESRSITTPQGQNLDATGPEATARLQQGQNLGGFFVPRPISSGTGDEPLPPLMLLSCRPRDQVIPPPLSPVDVPERLQGLLGQDRGVSTEHAIVQDKDTGGYTKSSLEKYHGLGCGSHNSYHSSHPPSTHYHPTGITPLITHEAHVHDPASGNFNHTISSRGRVSPLRYYTKIGLLRLEMFGATISSDESVQIHARAIGQANGHFILHLDRPKALGIRLTQRHGITPNAISLEFSLATVRPGTLRFNVPPGLFRVDMAPSHAGMVKQASATARAIFQGGESRQSFGLEGSIGSGGVRFKVNPHLVGQTVLVSRLGPAGEVEHTVTKVAPPVPH